LPGRPLRAASHGIGAGSQLLRQEDEDVGEALHSLFEDEGIDLV